MKKTIFYLLMCLAGCFFILSCEISRQTNVSVETTNAQNRNTTAERNAANADQSVENGAPVNDSEKMKPAVDDKQNTMVNTSAKKSGDKPEERCGWFQNPTPANAWLNDKDGEWLIGAQGGYQAEGDYPDIPDDQWVKTNINYGYGCACMRVAVDRKSKRILKIFTSTAKPLAACRKDPALKEPSE